MSMYGLTSPPEHESLLSSNIGPFIVTDFLKDNKCDFIVETTEKGPTFEFPLSICPVLIGYTDLQESSTVVRVGVPSPLAGS